MKYSRFLLTSLAISLGCYGCAGDAVESGPCTSADCQTETSCKCDDGTVCPDGDKDNCSNAQECKCDDGTDCPEGNKDNCSNAQECKCDDGTVCPEGNKDNCSNAQECKCDDNTDCPEGNKDNCTNAQECKCDDNTDCPEGNKDNCETAAQCTGEKPENAIQCDCVDGNWTNCTYPGENQCTEVCDAQKLTKCGSDGVMKCEPDSNGCAVWSTIEPCKEGSHCDDTQLKCVDNCSSPCDVNAPAKCDNGNVVTCKSDASGCASYQTTTCEKGSYCDAEKAACVPCKETCTAAKRCSAKGVESCTADAHGCAVWKLTETCPENTSCDSSKFKCTDACNSSCNSGQICDNGQCKCNPKLPSGWPSNLTPLNYPLMVPSKNNTMHGSDNIYAPDIHEVSGQRVMWYGAQGGDGHDRIFMAISSNGAEWRKYPSDGNPKPVLENGSSNHVNDPSLVHVGGVWKMYYTDAPTAEIDRIWLAESSKLTGFKKVQEVLGPGAAGQWDSYKVGRPSVLYEDGVYKMWYDGQAQGQGRHVGLATSTDGIHFTRHPSNPLLLNAGAIDVDKVGGVYVMLMEGQDGTYWATSVDGLCWVSQGKLFNRSGASYDAYGQVTPFLEVSGGKLRAVWFGGASVSSWNRNRIGAAFAPGEAPSGGGCTGCTSVGLTCTEACQNASAGTAGHCGNPGSTTAGSCCACESDGCEKCVVGVKDCHQACVNNGSSSGYCAHPGSTDSSKCCACLD
ncbi:MAG: hypothetical protein J6A01_07895 [Proteobacteria bacterium]|nr:hypothetical protein [Pseudomonadota bacterium]